MMRYASSIVLLQFTQIPCLQRFGPEHWALTIGDLDHTGPSCVTGLVTKGQVFDLILHRVNKG